MFRHFINTINYAKLIEMQSSQMQTRISDNSNRLNVNSNSKKGKCKTHNLNNSVKRHH